MKPVLHKKPYGHIHNTTSSTCTKSPVLFIWLLLSLLGWCVKIPRCYCSHCRAFRGQNWSVVLITTYVNGTRGLWLSPFFFSALLHVSLIAWKFFPHHTAKYFPLKPFIKTLIFTQPINTTCQPRWKLSNHWIFETKWKQVQIPLQKLEGSDTAQMKYSTYLLQNASFRIHSWHLYKIPGIYFMMQKS